MSELALNMGDGRMLSTNELAQPIRRRLTDARASRKPLEGTWQSNLAFAAGKFYLKWDRDQRRLVFPPALYNTELYSADVITEYRTTAIAELGSDDDRPELLLRHDDEAAEDFQAQLNRALGYGWDSEFSADEALEQADQMAVDMGTSAIRCRWDPNVGPAKGDVPHQDGKPVYGRAEQGALADQFSEGLMPGVQMQSVREGRICWEPLSPLQLLVPPGIPDERKFPWEAVTTVALLEDVKALYGDLAAELREDTDIGNALGLDANSEQTDGRGYGAWNDSGKPSRVRDSVWLTTYYERPSARWENGRVVVLGGNKLILLDHQEELPYVGPDGTYRSGIAYMHWQKVTGRFWGRALVEAMKDPQRSINKRRTQISQIIDRSMPALLVDEKQKEVINRKGTPMEVLALKNVANAPAPVVIPGVAPGPWMQGDVEAMREDLSHATGISDPRLGENPTSVTTYSQLALLHESDYTKREPIRRRRQRMVAQLVEDSVCDMRRYWGHEKQVMLAGDEDKVDAEIFDATRIPAFFLVKVAKGSAKPRSQAAELKKVEDLWQAAVDAGVVQTDPAGWIKWRKESMDAGQALDLPDQPKDAHLEKAHLENHALLEGEQPVAAYFDPHEVHIPVHREAQIQAELIGDTMAFLRVEHHIQSHLLAAQQNAMQLAQTQQQAQQSGPVLPGPMGETPVSQPGVPMGAGGAMGGGGQGPASSGPTGGSVASVGAGSAPPMNLTVPLTVHVPPANLSVAPPNVDVGAPTVNVPPAQVTVNVPKVQVQEQHVEFQRDEMGRITGAHVTKKPTRKP